MVAPFVLPLIPIVTAVGRFAAPYLVKELGKMGANKFAKTYGNEAFTSLNETLANNTPMVNPEAMPMVNPNYKSQQESKQNVTAFTGDLAIPGYIAPDAEAMEREAKKFREMLKPVGTPIEPPEIPIKTGEAVIPDIDLVEEFPAEDKPLPRPPGFGEGDKIEIPLITFSKDVPKDFKDIAKRSVGKEKGQKAVDTIFNDSIFDNVLTPEQIRNINELEAQYVGGIMDMGDPAVPLVFTNPLFKSYKEYFEDYKEKLAEAAKESLGEEFKMFRVMKKTDALKMLTESELPVIKVKDEDTGEQIPYTVDMLGENVEMTQENMSFSLNPRTAFSFKEIFFRDEPDENFVLLEYNASPSDIVMRGHGGEYDLVLNMSNAIDATQLFKLYDFKYIREGSKIKELQVSENKEFKNFVQPTKDKLTGVGKQTEALLEPKVEFGPLTETEKQTAKVLKEGKSDFYSRAVESIKNAKQNKFTKGKWKSIVQSNSTKDEMDYLGLTEYLKGNESITKEELLKFVEKKDIAPNITVRSIPKDEMSKMYERYSLGGYTAEDTQEHIVFQFRPYKEIKNPYLREPEKQKSKMKLVEYDTPLFKSEHFDTEYGTNTFAHARTQVGFDPLEEEMTRYQDLNNEEIEEAFKNTLIIDEIQSDWLQEGQDKGFVSEWKILKGDKITKEFLEDNFPDQYKLERGTFSIDDPTTSNILYSREVDREGNILDNFIPIKDLKDNNYYIFDKTGLHLGQAFEALSLEKAKREVAEKSVPDFPIKESKKFVELVLNKMIEKAVLDGRDSIAITNGQIQANRYDAMGEEKKEGLKKFYDEIVLKQLKKIADKYNVKLERVDISEPEEDLEDRQNAIQMQFPRQIKTAQKAGHALKKISLQELWDRIKDENIPGHTALYTKEGRGQGSDYIETWVEELVNNRDSRLGSGSGLSLWEQISKNPANEVYVWKEWNLGGKIIWDMPIVPVADTITNPAVNDMLNASSENREYIIRQFTIGGIDGYPYEGDNINNIDLIKYTEYLRNYKLPEGVDLGYDKDVEQLIKMKLPKKLQKERLSKPIKLSKAKTQTDRLFA